MLQSQAVPLENLVAPLSMDSVFVLIEVLNAQICDQMDVSLEIIKGINLNSDSSSQVFDQFLADGFLTCKSAISEDSLVGAGHLIDYFRQKKLRPAVKAYLFLDGKCLEHSGDSLASSYDVMDELKIPRNLEIAG